MPPKKGGQGSSSSKVKEDKVPYGPPTQQTDSEPFVPMVDIRFEKCELPSSSACLLSKKAHHRWSNRKTGLPKSRNKSPISRNNRKRPANPVRPSRGNERGPFERNRKPRMKSVEKRKLHS